MQKPNTFPELLDHWTTPELSAALAVPYVTARKMRERRSVGIGHWPRFIEAAGDKGIRLTLDDLARMRLRKDEAA